MGAGGEGKKIWRWNFGEGWVLAAKVKKNFLEMGLRRRMGAGGEGRKTFWRWNCGEGWVLAAKVKKNLEMEFW